MPDFTTRTRASLPPSGTGTSAIFTFLSLTLRAFIVRASTAHRIYLTVRVFYTFSESQFPTDIKEYLKLNFMRTLFFTAILTALLALLLSCENITPVSSDGKSGSPTEAYKGLYAAVKSKDTARIKSTMSKKTQEFAEMVAARQNSPIEKVFENGFTATTFSETLPEIRDERVSGEFGAVEVWNAKDKRWEDLGFVYEDIGRASCRERV